MKACPVNKTGLRAFKARRPSAVNSSTRQSKFLSYVLRHRPETIGLKLDAQGWTDVCELLERAAAAGMSISREELARLVATSDKQRFALSDSGTRIRANQGHSVDVDLQLPVATPPQMLYHGTVARSLDAIRVQVLRPGKRHDVHLSATPEVARKVGARRGAPVVLEIPTAPMLRDGFEFRVSANSVWLLPHVPAQYIQFPG